MSSVQAWNPSLDDRVVAQQLFQLSRRHAQPFSVVAIGSRLPGRDALVEILDSHEVENGFGDVGLPGAALRLGVRETDLLVHFGETGRYLLLCPNTAGVGSKDLIERLRQRVAEPGAVSFGAASFPDDAFVFEDVVDLAWQRAAQSDVTEAAASLRLVPHDESRRTTRMPFSKRVFDLVCVIASAPLWLPVLLVIASVIKLTEPSAPVFFKQMRTGRGGRRFPMYKFRTMVPNAEELKHELQHLNKLKWPDFKVDHDPRITRVGRFLRKTSLDEIPQILNVVTGDMSIVGPRPTSFPPETYEIWQTARLDVIPGITGLWQVEGRGSTEFDERLRLDLEYVAKQSLLFDLSILVRTVGAVLSRKGR